MSDVSNFEAIVKEMKEFADLKAYSNAQYNTIVEQNKQINKLKEEVAHLQRLVGTGVPAVGDSAISTITHLSPEEEICLTQLQILNDISKRGQLTLEETRKTEIYAKILAGLRTGPKDIPTPHKKIDTAELLKLAESIGSENAK